MRGMKIMSPNECKSCVSECIQLLNKLMQFCVFFRLCIETQKILSELLPLPSHKICVCSYPTEESYIAALLEGESHFQTQKLLKARISLYTVSKVLGRILFIFKFLRYNKAIYNSRKYAQQSRSNRPSRDRHSLSPLQGPVADASQSSRMNRRSVLSNNRNRSGLSHSFDEQQGRTQDQHLGSKSSSVSFSTTGNYTKDRFYQVAQQIHSSMKQSKMYSSPQYSFEDSTLPLSRYDQKKVRFSNDVGKSSKYYTKAVNSDSSFSDTDESVEQLYQSPSHHLEYGHNTRRMPYLPKQHQVKDDGDSDISVHDHRPEKTPRLPHLFGGHSHTKGKKISHTASLENSICSLDLSHRPYRHQEDRNSTVPHFLPEENANMLARYLDMFKAEGEKETIAVSEGKYRQCGQIFWHFTHHRMMVQLHFT